MSGSLQGKDWRLPPPPPEGWTAALAAELDLPPPLARLLHARGVASAAAAAAWLDPPPPDPGDLPDLDAAVARLARARAGGERVLVFGDYDCDGVCASAVAATALEACGLEVTVHLPRRADGYGLQADTLPGLARAAGAGLVLAVDNGTAAVEAVAAAAAAGIEVIVADHHQLGGTLPAAVAVVNPLRGPDGPLTGLAGVGVTWCLMEALGTVLGVPLPAAADLVALGTIADVVPLVGANRWLVRRGLAAMAGPGVRPGVRALLEACRVAAGTEPSVRDVSFGLAPRLNAPGRMEGPRPAWDLLRATDAAAAARALAEVERCNRLRQEESAVLLAAAEGAAAGYPADRRAVVLADARWSPGLVGPVASRLVERLRVPVLLAGIDARGVCRGSGRGPAGWDLTAALQRCAGVLRRFGGHAQAAGFEVEAARLDELRAALSALAPEGGGPDGTAEPWTLDGELAADELGPALAAACERLAPFGAGHPEPAFLLRGVRVLESRPLGRDGRHLRLRLQPAGPPGARPWPAVAFGFGPWAEGCAGGGPLDLVVRPELDRYGGRETLQVQVHDLAPTARDWGAFAEAAALALPRRHPDREALAAAFRRLRALAAPGGGTLPPEPVLLRHLCPACLPGPEAVAAALTIFREVGLLSADGRLCEPGGQRKLDLTQSPRYRAAAGVREAIARLRAGA